MAGCGRPALLLAQFRHPAGEQSLHRRLHHRRRGKRLLHLHSFIRAQSALSSDHSQSLQGFTHAQLRLAARFPSAEQHLHHRSAQYSSSNPAASTSLSPSTTSSKSTMTISITPSHTLPANGCIQITLDRTYATAAQPTAAFLISEVPTCQAVTVLLSYPERFGQPLLQLHAHHQQHHRHRRQHLHRAQQLALQLLALSFQQPALHAAIRQLHLPHTHAVPQRILDRLIHQQQDHRRHCRLSPKPHSLPRQLPNR